MTDSRTEIPPLCQMARMWVSAAADGECGDTELAAMRQHLGQCPACSAWQATVESVSLHVRTAIPAVPSVSLVPGLEAVRSRTPRRRIRVASLLATVAASLTLGFVVAGTRSGDQPASTPTRPAPELVARTKGVDGSLDGVNVPVAPR